MLNHRQIRFLSSGLLVLSAISLSACLGGGDKATTDDSQLEACTLVAIEDVGGTGTGDAEPIGDDTAVETDSTATETETTETETTETETTETETTETETTAAEPEDSEPNPTAANADAPDEATDGDEADDTTPKEKSGNAGDKVIEVKMDCGGETVVVSWKQFRRKLKINPKKYQNRIAKFGELVTCTPSTAENITQLRCQTPEQEGTDQFITVKATTVD